VAAGSPTATTAARARSAPISSSTARR